MLSSYLKTVHGAVLIQTEIFENLFCEPLQRHTPQKSALGRYCSVASKLRKH